MASQAPESSAECVLCGRRGPKVNVTQKIKIKEVLRLAAAIRSLGGVEGTLMDMLRATRAGDEAVSAACSRLEEPEADLLRKNIAARRHSLYCQNQTSLWELKDSTVEQVRELKLKRSATTLRDQWFRAPESGSLRAAADSPAMIKKSRPAAVGTLPSIQPNRILPLTKAPGGGAAIPEMLVPRVVLRVRASLVIPKRRAPHVPVDEQQKEQWVEVQSWQLQRLLEGRCDDDDFFFGIEAMRKKVKAWREASECGQWEAPPIDVIAAPASSDILPALTTQFSGHIWSVRGYGGMPAPFDARQCAAAQATPELGDQLQAMVDCEFSSITESKVRQLAGQATNGAAAKFLLEKWKQRLSARGRRTLKTSAGMTVGLLGSGGGFSGYQTLRWMGGGKIVFVAEGCPIARAASEEIDAAMGQNPVRFSRVEDSRLASAAMHASVEWITLSCAQVSRRGTGEYLEAWLNEVAITLAGTCARKPGGVFFETADGAWDCKDTKGRLESLFNGCRQYSFVAYLISPDAHLGWGARRRRVYYVGTRKDAVWMASVSGAKEAKERKMKEGEVRKEEEEEGGRLSGRKEEGPAAVEAKVTVRAVRDRAGLKENQKKRLREKKEEEQRAEEAHAEEAPQAMGDGSNETLQMREGMLTSLQEIDAVARTAYTRRALPQVPELGMLVLLHAHDGELVVPARVQVREPVGAPTLGKWRVDLRIGRAGIGTKDITMGGVEWQGSQEGSAWVEGIPGMMAKGVMAETKEEAEGRAAREEWRQAEAAASSRATQEAVEAAREWASGRRPQKARRVTKRSLSRAAVAREAVLPEVDERGVDEHGGRPWARPRQAWRVAVKESEKGPEGEGGEEERAGGGEASTSRVGRLQQE